MILKNKSDQEKFLLELKEEIYRIYNEDLTDGEQHQKTNNSIILTEETEVDFKKRLKLSVSPEDYNHKVPHLDLKHTGQSTSLKLTKLKILTMFYHNLEILYKRNMEIDTSKEGDNNFGIRSSMYLTMHRRHAQRFFQKYLPDFLMPNTDIRDFFKKWDINLNGGIGSDAHIDKTLRL